jgi:hypothetical protein
MRSKDLAEFKDLLAIVEILGEPVTYNYKKTAVPETPLGLFGRMMRRLAISHIRISSN